MLKFTIIIELCVDTKVLYYPLHRIMMLITNVDVSLKPS